MTRAWAQSKCFFLKCYLDGGASICFMADWKFAWLEGKKSSTARGLSVDQIFFSKESPGRQDKGLGSVQVFFLEMLLGRWGVHMLHG